MGPRTGSPAAETQRNYGVYSHVIRSRGGNLPGFAGFVFGICLSLLVNREIVWAATAEVSHTVTAIVVTPELSIRSDASEKLSLSFSDSRRGAESNEQQVQYRVSGNSLPEQSYDGILSAKIEDSSPGIVLEADVGTFTNNGTPDNITLYEHSSGYHVVGTDATPLATKSSSLGTQATVLNGTLPVTWKATATEKLADGRYRIVITITLKDS